MWMKSGFIRERWRMPIMNASHSFSTLAITTLAKIFLWMIPILESMLLWAHGCCSHVLQSPLSDPMPHAAKWQRIGLCTLFCSQFLNGYKANLTYYTGSSAHWSRLAPEIMEWSKMKQEKGKEREQKRKQGVCHTLAYPFTLKHILRQKKNYGNSNISPCKNTISKKSSKRNQNHSRHYNSITNLKFQHKPKYHCSKTLI